MKWANQSAERTWASRLAPLQFVRQGRLAPAAHAGRWAERRAGEEAALSCIHSVEILNAKAQRGKDAEVLKELRLKSKSR